MILVLEILGVWLLLGALTIAALNGARYAVKNRSNR